LDLCRSSFLYSVTSSVAVALRPAGILPARRVAGFTAASFLLSRPSSCHRARAFHMNPSARTPLSSCSLSAPPARPLVPLAVGETRGARWPLLCGAALGARPFLSCRPGMWLVRAGRGDGPASRSPRKSPPPDAKWSIVAPRRLLAFRSRCELCSSAFNWAHPRRPFTAPGYISSGDDPRRGFSNESHRGASRTRRGRARPISS